jgi:hypothetical protein
MVPTEWLMPVDLLQKQEGRRVYVLRCTKELH